MSHLTVGLAQTAPIWLNREATLARICAMMERAGSENCDLVAFGEALLPGYPFWIERTDGARFDSALQQEFHARYLAAAVDLSEGHLDSVRSVAVDKGVAVYLGIIERTKERGGHSLYCSLVYIDAEGQIRSVHRKLMPTYEERLSWSAGDGHGLKVHDIGMGFRVGGLNCWENWMPLARSALYAQGENVHVAVWPGSVRNTEDITRFVARESRSFVLSASSILRPEDIPSDFPERDVLIQPPLPNGGSCIAAPDGSWLIEPVADKEGLFIADLELDQVYAARQNFDPSGHYSRPDVLELHVDRRRQKAAIFRDE